MEWSGQLLLVALVIGALLASGVLASVATGVEFRTDRGQRSRRLLGTRLDRWRRGGPAYRTKAHGLELERRARVALERHALLDHDQQRAAVVEAREHAEQRASIGEVTTRGQSARAQAATEEREQHGDASIGIGRGPLQSGRHVFDRSAHLRT